MGIDRTAKVCEGDLTEFTWGDCEYCPHCGATFSHGIGAGKPDWKKECAIDTATSTSLVLQHRK